MMCDKVRQRCNQVTKVIPTNYSKIHLAEVNIKGMAYHPPCQSTHPAVQNAKELKSSYCSAGAFVVILPSV